MLDYIQEAKGAESSLRLLRIQTKLPKEEWELVKHRGGRYVPDRGYDISEDMEMGSSSEPLEDEGGVWKRQIPPCAALSLMSLYTELHLVHMAPHSLLFFRNAAVILVFSCM